jgi:hypothetical protein
VWRPGAALLCSQPEAIQSGSDVGGQEDRAPLLEESAKTLLLLGKVGRKAEPDYRGSYRICRECRPGTGVEALAIQQIGDRGR